MYIKLNFTANVTQKTVWRLVQDIVETNTITSIAALQTRSAAYHAHLKSNIDWDNSEIIRTLDPVNTNARISIHTTNDSGFYFTLRQQIHDSPGEYIYYHIYDGTYEYRPLVRVSDAVDNNFDAATSIPVSVPNVDDYRGSQLLPAGSIYNFPTHIAYEGENGNDLRSFKAYITNDTFMFSFYAKSVGSTGYGTTFNNNTYYTGPWMFMQYRRFDYFNTPENGILPVIFSNPHETTRNLGFGLDYHWNNAVNTRSSQTNRAPFRIFNMISADDRIGSSYPTIYFPHVAHSAGYATAEGRALIYEAYDTSGVTDVSLGNVISSTANERFPTADLSGNGYGLLPIGWTNTAYGNMGGNITDLNNVYFFNGEYQPGDEIAVGEKIYSLWPGYYGYSNRFAVAVPKE